MGRCFLGGGEVRGYFCPSTVHITYVSAAKVGDMLEIEARANRVGGTMAFTTIEIGKVGGGMVATGGHTKFIRT